MPNFTFSVQVSALGKSYSRSETLQFDGATVRDPVVPGAAQGVLTTTNTSTNTGTFTASNHGCTTGDRLFITWDGGFRQYVEVTSVTTNTVTFTGGSGSNLPTVPPNVNILFNKYHLEQFNVPTTLKMLIGDSAATLCSIVVQDSTNYTILPAIESNSIYYWNYQIGPPPFNYAATEVLMSHNSQSPSTVEFVALYD